MALFYLISTLIVAVALVVVPSSSCCYVSTSANQLAWGTTSSAATATDVVSDSTLLLGEQIGQTLPPFGSQSIEPNQGGEGMQIIDSTNGGGGAGSGLTQLTSSDTSWEGLPAWSPDGTKIAFVSGTLASSDIYVINAADGSGLTQLTSDPSREYDPVWSPDGTKIAFVSETDVGEDYYYDIYIINAADGSGLTQLTNDDATSRDHNPVWSPDGTRIAFEGNSTGNYDIYIINAADGSGLTQLTSGTSYDSYPVWSPDGTRIAFVSSRNGTQDSEDIYVVNADGNGPIQLTDNPFRDTSPAWSPDSTKIAFDRESSSELADDDIYSDIYVISVPAASNDDFGGGSGSSEQTGQLTDNDRGTTVITPSCPTGYVFDASLDGCVPAQ